MEIGINAFSYPGLKADDPCDDRREYLTKANFQKLQEKLGQYMEEIWTRTKEYTFQAFIKEQQRDHEKKG